ncbi:MAG TPA: AI-2E family transporter [Candidatus Binatia bacterium]|nr:AI-2E family transporter [Candidatus Binatia bacterium]
MSGKETINITNRTIIRTFLWVVVFILLYKFIGRVTHELTLIFASFFLALALNPVVSSMSRRLKIESRVRATAAAYLMVIALIALFFALVTPPLIRQTRTFISDVPQIVDSFQNQDTHYARLARRYKLDDKITTGAKDFANNYANYGSTVFDTGKRVAEAFVSIIVVVIMTFMMLVEGPKLLDSFFGLMPAGRRAHDKDLAHQMYRGVTGFVNGQVILGIIAGVFAFAALEIASHLTDSSVNALAMAGIVAVFALIPLFGNPISTIIVVLVCLSTSASLALIMLIYFVVYFFIESHTIQPVIQSKLTNISPLIVFMAAIIGIGFAGFLGAIIAIPTANAIKILVEDQISKRGLKNA